MSTVVYSFGLVHASVCSDDSEDVILMHVNREHPTGLAHGWTLSEDPTFASGHPNPGPCNTDDDRKHYLLVC